MAHGRSRDSDDEGGLDSWLDRVKESDALVVYEQDDEYEVFKTVLQYLDSHGLTYALPQIEYPGGNIMSSTSKAIQKAKKVLLILSQNSNNAKFSLETFLALEKCVKHNQLCLTILTLRGFERRNIAHIPMLQNATIVELDYNRQEICLEAVVKHIKEENVTLKDVIPAGNFATGLAWSHFTGYLKIILPDIPRLIRESRTYRENPGRFVEKFFILIPRSGRAFPLIEDMRISKEDEKLSLQKTVNGAPRTYSPVVYRVSADNGQQHFCCAEIPSAFGTIGRVFEEILGHITPQQRANEVERFFYKLQEILNYQLNDRLSETVEVIMYNDETKDDSGTASHQLLKRFTRKGATSDLPPTPKMEKKNIKNDVCLLFATCDSKYALSVRVALENKGKKVIKVELPDQSLHESELRVTSAAWAVLFMSTAAMSNSGCISLWMANVLSSSLEDNELRVIPVLIDADPSRIPDFIRWVTYISIKEEGYQDRILDIVNGKPVSMKSLSPVGNIAYGLAWAFFMNYLQHALRDLEKRSEAKLKEISADPRKCLPTLFEFIPMSAKTINELDRIETSKYGIENFGSVKQIESKVSGVQRNFDVNMYGIYTKSHYHEPREYVKYFMGEFAAPLRTLRLMHESFAGLNNEQLTGQIRQFKDEMEWILGQVPSDDNKLSYVRHRCTPLLYDDNKENLIDVLLKEIDKIGTAEKARRALRVGCVQPEQ